MIGALNMRRMPNVSRRYPVGAEMITVASPFGGALYFDVGGNTFGFSGVEPLVVHGLPDFRVITSDDNLPRPNILRPAYRGQETSWLLWASDRMGRVCAGSLDGPWDVSCRVPPEARCGKARRWQVKWTLTRFDVPLPKRL